MTTYRQHLIYDAGFSSPNRWLVMDSGDAIRVRFRFASEPEKVETLTLDTARLRMLDVDTFATAPLEIPECAGRIEFVLRGAPEHVTTALRQALETSPTGRPTR